MKKFVVMENKENFRVFSDNNNMIQFYGTISIQDLGIEDNLIRKYRFNLFDYSNFETRKGTFFFSIKLSPSLYNHLTKYYVTNHLYTYIGYKQIQTNKR